MGSVPQSQNQVLELRYHFRYDKTQTKSFVIRLDPVTLYHQKPSRTQLPDWTALPFSKCRLCPLKSPEHSHCPAAVSLIDVVEFFAGFVSFHETELIVETPRRMISAKTTVQEGVRAMMGLVLATSGCPILGKFKPMAFIHLPLASPEETAFRAISTYLLGQYIRMSKGQVATWDLQGLMEIYQRVHDVNVDFLNRLKAASTNDANINSLVGLDIFTMTVPRFLEKQIEKLAPLYEHHLD